MDVSDAGRAALPEEAGRAAADSRYAREKAFHDQENERWQAVSKFYTVTTTSHAFYEEQLFAGCSGKRVLEYGCGDGSYAFDLEDRGAHVTGIDISEHRIRRAREVAGGRRARAVEFAVMNAEALEFDDDSFDLVCGTSILHHLDLERAFAELARTLSVDGEAVFLEPLGHNPAINLYRWLTPGYRTPDEHPLRLRDLRLAGTYFGDVETRFFHLFSLLGVPLRDRSRYGKLHRTLERLDQRVFAQVPALRRYAWIVVVSLRHPHKVEAGTSVQARVDRLGD
jgi:SAM-dependent methyltransferase